jgi:tRNA threonylcarbamoyladenosine biosynthesis protein TsaB
MIYPVALLGECQNTPKISDHTLLALDTSTDACSVALFHQNQITEHFEVAPRRHNELILPLLQTILDKANITLEQVNAIAFGCGPGSFTGLRIAASVAQAIAFAKSLPVIPISTLRALAQQAHRELQSTQVIAALDAHMNEIYWGAFEFDNNNLAQARTAEFVCAPSSILGSIDKPLQSLVGIGSGFDQYQEILLPMLAEKLQHWIPQRYPRAYDIALLAANDYKLGNVVNAEAALPVYLRNEIVGKLKTQA